MMQLIALLATLLSVIGFLIAFAYFMSVAEKFKDTKPYSQERIIEDRSAIYLVISLIAMMGSILVTALIIKGPL